MPHFEHGPLTILLVQIITIVAVARLLAAGVRRLGQPSVIAEILAGIVLGPSLLGLLWPEAMAFLFPPESLRILKMLSQVGLVLFMFLVGLELDPKLLRGRTHASIAISHTSIIVPFLLGAALAAVVHARYSDPAVPLSSFALFMGIAMSVTAFPVLARILSERNILTSRLGAIVIACAAVDDVTAWCLLAFVVAIAKANAITDALWTTVLASGFVAFMVFAVRPFLRRVGTRVITPEGLTPSLIALTLVMLLGSAAITETIGIHALFGAFLFGAVLPKEGGLAPALVEKIETIPTMLLLPLFFAYSGIRTEIGLIDGARDWAVTGGIVLVATAGKFGGSAIAARVTGLGWRESSAIGVLMNTRGLMELIVLNIGLDIGVLTPTLFTMLVIMALVTTFATTPALKWVFPNRDHLLDRAVAALPESEGRSAEFGVLLCVSDPRSGPGMAVLANALAGERRDATCTALHLRGPSARPSVESREAASDPLLPLLQRARELALDVSPVSFVSAEPAEDIARTAEAKSASIVVLGWHKPLLMEGWLGGTVNDVVAKSRAPVAVLVDRGLRKAERILVAFAGGTEDVDALRIARRLGASPASSVTLLHVVEPGDRGGEGRRRIDHDFGPTAGDPRITLRVVESRAPIEVALEEAEGSYDLVVVGLARTWGLSRHPLAMRRERFLQQCRNSVLVVHSPMVPMTAEARAQQVRATSPSY